MKKMILLLINGFGIEQKDSFNIYKNGLMPNLDLLTKEALFSSIETNEFNLPDAFRNFSTESKGALTYGFLDKYSLELTSNPNYNTYISSMVDGAKIHLFCFVENQNSYEHLKNIISTINKKIILHLVLTSENIDNYSWLDRFITKVNFELKTCEIGSIVGLHTMLGANKDYTMMLKNGIGEKWHEFGKKLDSLSKNKVVPLDVKGFYMNDNFTIDPNDSIFLLNYSHVDATNFVNNISDIYKKGIYSMFPIQGIPYPLYAYPTSSVSLVNDLKSSNTNCLIVSDENSINYLNYYGNGLKNVNDPALMFIKASDELLYNDSILNSILNDERFKFIILNYTIDDCTTINSISERLTKIDSAIGFIKDVTLNNNMTLIVSSLYGIKKEVNQDQYIKKLVNFSSRVPMIVYDADIKKLNYTIDLGNIIGLKYTCLKLINPEYRGSGLIKKKGFLDKLLKK